MSWSSRPWFSLSCFYLRNRQYVTCWRHESDGVRRGFQRAYPPVNLPVHIRLGPCCAELAPPLAARPPAKLVLPRPWDPLSLVNHPVDVCLWACLGKLTAPQLVAHVWIVLPGACNQGLEIRNEGQDSRAYSRPRCFPLGAFLLALIGEFRSHQGQTVMRVRAREVN